MIQILADNIAKFIVKNDDTADYEVLAYGYGLIVSGVVNYTVILVSALLFGVIVEMLIALAVFITMRLTVGGAHANSRAVCFIVHSASLYLSIILAFVITPGIVMIVALYLVNMVLLILYAPSDTADQPIVKRRTARKILGIIFLSLFFSGSVIWHDMRIESNIVILLSTLTCIMLHPLIYRVFGCKKSI